MKPKFRKRARSFAVQALYQWLMSGTEVAVIESQFLGDNDFTKVDELFFSQLLRGVIEHAAELDREISPFIDRQLRELDPVELSVLRMGTYELTKCPDIPYRVAINEAVEQAKKFGATDGYKFVNGVLDKILRRLELRNIKSACSN